MTTSTSRGDALVAAVQQGSKTSSNMCQLCMTTSTSRGDALAAAGQQGSKTSSITLAESVQLQQVVW
jgi:hypothetical protein